MNQFKKVLACLLAVVMLFSVMSVSVFATDECDHEWTEWMNSEVYKYYPTVYSKLHANTHFHECTKCGLIEEHQPQMVDYKCIPVHEYVYVDEDIRLDEGHVGTCLVCGEDFEEEHLFTDWSSNGDRGFFRNGTLSRSCVTCGHEEIMEECRSSLFFILVHWFIGAFEFIGRVVTEPLHILWNIGSVITQG